jgi:phage tail-like protein
LADGAPAKGARTVDPPFAALFKVTIDDIGEIGSFTECSGLSVEAEVEEVKEGGQNHLTHKLPGRMKWPTLRLKRGLIDNDTLFEWFLKTSGNGFAAEGKLKTRTGEVTLVGSDGTKIRSWSFVGAIPVKWTGPTLATSSNEAGTEELEIAHHGFRVS